MKQRKKKTRRRTDLRFSPVSCHHQSTQNQQTGRARHGQMCFLLCLEKYPGVLWRSFGPDVGEESSRDSFRFFGSSVFHGKWYIIPSLFLLFLSLMWKNTFFKAWWFGGANPLGVLLQGKLTSLWSTWWGHDPEKTLAITTKSKCLKMKYKKRS